MTPQYKRILIAQTAFLGDIVLTTALIRETKKLFPEAEIDFLTAPRTVNLVSGNPHLNEIVVFDKHNRKYRNFMKLVPIMRKKKYDLAIIPHSYLTTNLLVLLAGIPNRCGFNRRISRFLLTKRVEYGKGHVSKRILRLLSPFTKEELNSETELFYTPQQEEKALKYLPDKEKTIAIAPGSVWNTKRWLKEYFTELCRLLSQKGFKLVLIGSSQEKELAEEIVKISQADAIDACGKLTLLESTALLAKVKLLVCNDSAPLHLANAVNTPVFAMFGPTVKEFGFYPYRKHDHIFEKEMACRPCGLHGSSKCPLGHHKCMKDIKPEEVFAAIMDYIEK